MRRSILLAWLITVFILSITAQPESRQVGSISGKISDSETNLPVEYANVLVMKKTDSSLVNGSLTNSEGIFIINQVPFGRYLVKVSFLGYEEKWLEPIHLNQEERNAYFEQINIKPSAAVLSEFRVTGERSVLEMQIDRRVFNVDQSIISQGQSATEVLENVPSVEVDMDGNVSLRGSENITILIDGRPSAMLGSDVSTALRQIPANMIESVEIITNPSAKYDPEGMSGIINIKLRKDRNVGFNAMVSGGYGTWGKYNGSVNLNYRTQNINIFGSYSLNNRNWFRRGSTYTINEQNVDSLFYVDQELDMIGLRNVQMYRAGADWFINSNNTLSAFFTVNANNRSSEDTINAIYKDNYKIESLINDRITERISSGSGNSMVLTWQRTFDKPRQELIVDANYSFNEGNSDYLYTDHFKLIDYNHVDLFGYDHQLSFDKSIIASLQADYAHPFTADSRLETGARIGYRLLDEDWDASRFDTMQDLWIPDTNRINHFIYDELITAFYATYAARVNKFSYQAGLRYENTGISGDLKNTGEKFDKNYSSLFPSVHLSYKINKITEVQISYSRRISRPRSRALNPFENYSDPMNIRKGNPDLEPEFTNSFEMGFSRFFEKGSLMSSIYYRKINNQITRFKYMTPEGTTIMSRENLNSAMQYGYELIGTYNPFNWWSVNATFNMHQRFLDADRIQEGLSNSGIMWSVRFMSTMNFTTGTSVQLTGSYSSPIVLPIGISATRYRADLGIRQQLFNNKASLSLRVSDLFYTARWKVSLDGNGFTQEVERYFDSRVAYLTFTYQIGQQQRDSQRRDRHRRNGDDFDNGSEDVMF